MWVKLLCSRVFRVSMRSDSEARKGADSPRQPSDLKPLSCSCRLLTGTSHRVRPTPWHPNRVLPDTVDPRGARGKEVEHTQGKGRCARASSPGDRDHDTPEGPRV